MNKAYHTYDPMTGIVTRHNHHTAKYNGPCGWPSEDGYLRMRFEGGTYPVHHVAFYLMTGRWPDPELDHRNGVRTDNRWANLREATRSVQCQNRRYKATPSGYRGVKRYKGKWGARITQHQVTHFLGLFDTPEQAHAAYVAAARERYGQEATV